ncbi:MAG: Spy/CpxP family protein refolding chaperone, partial [Betaproteobacteria bacterium]
MMIRTTAHRWGPAADAPRPMSTLRASLLTLVVAAGSLTHAQTPWPPQPGSTPAPASPAVGVPPTASAPPLPGGEASPRPLPTRSVSASTLGAPQSAASEAALERLHQQLQLSAEQEAFWQRYVRELDAATGMMMRERPVATGPDEGAAQQLGRVAMQLQNRLAAMETIEKAARELHAVLNPEQQKLANQGLLATLPPLLAATPIAGLAGPREDNRGRNDGAMRSRRGGMGGGIG